MAIFQIIVVLVLGFMAGMILTSVEIPILKHKQFQQFIREEGPQSHQSKAGTPTMGGIAIYVAIVICSLIGVKASVDLVESVDVFSAVRLEGSEIILVSGMVQVVHVLVLVSADRRLVHSEKIYRKV